MAMMVVLVMATQVQDSVAMAKDKRESMRHLSHGGIARSRAPLTTDLGGGSPASTKWLDPGGCMEDVWSIHNTPALATVRRV